MKAVSIDALLATGHHHSPDDYPELATWDEYPSLQPPDGQSLRMILDQLLADLPTDQGRAVEMTVIAGMPYRRAARELGYWNGQTGEPDGKKCWRVSRRGLRSLRCQLESGWARAFIDHRVHE